VRPLLVVNADEVLEAFLLLQEVERSGLGSFVLQRQVHALMAAVLLRLAGLDALQADAQTQPPDGQAREPEQSPGGGERRAVVGADRVGKSRSMLRKVATASSGISAPS